MKILTTEYEGCFSIELEAENMEDASFITRFGTNSTKELRSVSAYASKSGGFSCSVVIAKHRKADSQIIRRK